jgi:hypothetical protein
MGANLKGNLYLGISISLYKREIVSGRRPVYIFVEWMALLKSLDTR